MNYLNVPKEQEVVVLTWKTDSCEYANKFTIEDLSNGNWNKQDCFVCNDFEGDIMIISFVSLLKLTC